MKSLVACLVLACGLMTGCASVKMEQAQVIEKPKSDVAVVTFVRTRMFFGDGMPIDIWDGTTYVGSLAAGTIVQYEAKPGQHLFIGSAENWSYAKAELDAGKHYFVKAILFPGVLTGRVALAELKPNDAEAKDWLAMRAMGSSEAERQAVSEKNKEKVQGAVNQFNEGKVTSFATLQRTDGR